MTAPNESHTKSKTSRLNYDLLRRIFASDQAMYPAPLTFERLKSWVDVYPELSIVFYDDNYEHPDPKDPHPNDPDVDTDANPDSSSAGKEAAALGVIIVLPILSEPYWSDLLVGKIKETDVDVGVMFPSRDDSPFGDEAGDGEKVGGEEREGKGEEKGKEGEVEVGLHVFHVERFASPCTSTRTNMEAVLDPSEPQKMRRKGGFTKKAIDEVLLRVSGLNQGNRRRKWKISGLSGK